MRKILCFVWTALFLLMIALPVYAEDDPGRAYYDFGVFAYEDGKYDAAETHFATAIGFNPDNPFYRHYMGRTYLKLERYDKAEEHLGKALSLNPDIPGLQYDMGMLFYKTENYAKAADFFVRAVREDANNVLAHYYAGLNLMKAQNYKDAAGYFVTAAQKSPTIGGNGYYYAGLCYQKAEDFDTAIQMFEKVKLDPNAEKLKENADKWIEAIKAKQKALTPYSLYLKLGRRYDSNVTLDTLDSDRFSDKKDWNTVLYFSGKYDLLKGSNYTFGAGYSHYQSWYDSLNEYDLTGSIFNLYAMWHLSPITLGFSYQPAYYWLDGDSYLRQHRFTPEVTWLINAQLTARFAYTYADNGYLGDETRTGHANEISADLYYKMWDGKAYLFGGIGYEDNCASWEQSYSQIRTHLGISVNLPFELTAVVSGNYFAKDYAHADSIFLKDRADDKYVGSVSLSRKLYEDWLAIMAEVSFTKNRSDISVYEYEKNMITLSLTASY